MAACHLIRPFPDDIDRLAFGHWLSGLVDGEGCFMLRFWRRRRPSGREHNMFAVRFQLTLRSDDVEILENIRSYWQCGGIRLEVRRDRAHPFCTYEIQKAAALREIIIPHFESYPLRAKKRHDFLAWKRGVELAYQVCSRPRLRVDRGGLAPAWSDAERDEFAQCVNALKAAREFPSA